MRCPMKVRSTSSGGFTLIELIVVIANHRGYVIGFGLPAVQKVSEALRHLAHCRNNMKKGAGRPTLSRYYGDLMRAMRSSVGIYSAGTFSALAGSALLENCRGARSGAAYIMPYVRRRQMCTTSPYNFTPSSRARSPRLTSRKYMHDPATGCPRGNRLPKMAPVLLVPCGAPVFLRLVHKQPKSMPKVFVCQALAGAGWGEDTRPGKRITRSTVDTQNGGCCLSVTIARLPTTAMGSARQSCQDGRHYRRHSTRFVP